MPRPDDPLTYQRMLDHVLEETFPASDPIAPGGASCCDGDGVETARDPIDWQRAAARSVDDADPPADSGAGIRDEPPPPGR